MNQYVESDQWIRIIFLKWWTQMTSSDEYRMWMTEWIKSDSNHNHEEQYLKENIEKTRVKDLICGVEECEKERNGKYKEYREQSNLWKE